MFLLINCIWGLALFNAPSTFEDKESKGSFGVIYQVYLHPEREVDYQRAWELVANYFVQHRGAIGSCLHRGENGLWVIYSRWPDQKTRDASWPVEGLALEELPQEVTEAVLLLKECVEVKLPEIRLEVVNDLLVSPNKEGLS